LVGIIPNEDANSPLCQTAIIAIIMCLFDGRSVGLMESRGSDGSLRRLDDRSACDRAQYLRDRVFSQGRSAPSA
jgi:hypothetical protein